MSTSYYDQPRQGWNSKIPLGKYAFLNPYTVAVIALNGVWLLALVHKFWIAIVLAVVYYIFELAYLIVQQRYYEVTAAYLLVQVIFGNLIYLADIILLVVVFGVLFQSLQRPETGYSGYRGILYAHYAFRGVIFVLDLAIFGTTVRDLQNAVFNEALTVSSVNGRSVQYALDVAFDALYACASLEVLVISVSILLKHRNHRTNNSIGTLLVALIGFPLFVRGFFILGDRIAYEIEYAIAGVLELSIAYTVIAGITWVLAFAGLVAIGLQPEYTDFCFDLENRAMPEGHFAPSHAPPSARPSSQSSQISLDKEHANRTGNRFTEWRPSLPSWRKGGKSHLGFGTAF